jgi:hypothetical protein
MWRICRSRLSRWIACTSYRQRLAAEAGIDDALAVVFLVDVLELLLRNLDQRALKTPPVDHGPG